MGNVVERVIGGGEWGFGFGGNGAVSGHDLRRLVGGGERRESLDHGDGGRGREGGREGGRGGGMEWNWGGRV